MKIKAMILKKESREFKGKDGQMVAYHIWSLLDRGSMRVIECLCSSEQVKQYAYLKSHDEGGDYVDLELDAVAGQKRGEYKFRLLGEVVGEKKAK